ncbi:MAG: DNA polymerase I [Desulfohalobiaceae bacterium]|nr:DNA polymerase I [Desulfohalobiaceae bacterium]
MSIKERFNWTREPLFLIDGTSFLYRAFYAYPDLTRSDGFPTNAMYIMFRILLKIIREEQPRYCCFFLDGKGPTFRTEIMESYKAQRLKMPEPLTRQIPPLLEGVKRLGLPQTVGQDGEADDYIASYATSFKSQRPVVILGSDKDLLQCLDEEVVIWDPGTRREKVVTLADFTKTEGLNPEQWPDFQALTGDKSDNIPGVPGIGPKTAKKLLQRYPSLEALRDNFDRLTRKEQEKLQGHVEDIFVYRRLTRLRTDLADSISLEDFACCRPDFSELNDFFQEYEFKSLTRELEPFADVPPADRPPQDPVPAEPVLRKKGGKLPDLTGQRVGIRHDSLAKQWSVGCVQEETRTDLPADRILDYVRNASEIFVPSFKELLTTDPGWENLQDRIFDLSLMAYLINPEERDYGWKRIQKAYLQQTDVHEDNPGLAVLEIGLYLQNQIQNAGLSDLLRSIETPLIPVLVKMEQTGLGIDSEAFEGFLAEVENRLLELTETIYRQAGQEFNLRSPQQLAEVLFIKLGLQSRRKTPGGLPSTAVPVLESLCGEHPVIENILEFRSLEKLRSTYLDPLPRQIGPDGRLHTTFNNLGTATGRLSSSRPNLQNIPIRGEFGYRMRSCFVAGKGYSLVAADYSQIELRLLAHLSRDENLLMAFSRSEDIHARTAGLIFDKDPQSITPDERRKAKTINFGLLYGMGPVHLGRELGLSVREAKKFIEIYFERLQKVRDFYRETEQRAREQGFVCTLAGRRRVLKDLNSRNENLAAQARRMAINTVVQGSAADIIKMAMNRVDRDPELCSSGARLVLQVHDELLLEAPAHGAAAAGQRIAAIMSSVTELSVPLEVDWGTGSSWAEAH